MSTNAQATDNPLDSAVRQLRSISDDAELLKSSTTDAGSLKRMIVHITNINASVLASSQDRLNATKRLNDFALTLTRMVRITDPANDVLTSRMTSVADQLRTASEELAQSDAVPNWRAPVSNGL